MRLQEWFYEPIKIINIYCSICYFIISTIAFLRNYQIIAQRSSKVFHVNKQEACKIYKSKLVGWLPRQQQSCKSEQNMLSLPLCLNENYTEYILTKYARNQHAKIAIFVHPPPCTDWTVIFSL